MLNLLTNTLPEGGRMLEVPEALLYAIIGFIVVFAGIALLIAVVWAVGKLMSNVAPQATPKAVAPVTTQQTPKTVQSEELDEETLAVITATLMAYYQKNNPKCGFTVKRIKRI